MAVEWWRSWHGAPTDPKWLSVAKRAAVSPGVVVAVAWALIDHASQAGERGDVSGFDCEALGDYLGFGEGEVAAVLQAMRDKSIIIGDRLSSWNKRQPKRERDQDISTERVRAFRDKQRHVTPRNATKRLDKEKDTDTEVEKEKEKKEIGADAPRDELEKVLDPLHAEAVVAHRVRLKKPLTAHAAKLLAGKFSKCADPNAAADAMISNGWQGFEPEWLSHRKGQGPPIESERFGGLVIAELGEKHG